MIHLTYSYIHRRAIYRDQRQATGLKNIYFLKYALIIFNILFIINYLSFVLISVNDYILQF